MVTVDGQYLRKELSSLDIKAAKSDDDTTKEFRELINKLSPAEIAKIIYLAETLLSAREQSSFPSE